MRGTGEGDRWERQVGEQVRGQVRGTGEGTGEGTGGRDRWGDR